MKNDPEHGIPDSPSGNAEAEHQQAASDQHENSEATQQPPPSARPIPGQQPKNQHESGAKPEHEGNWYASPDWWVAGFTGALFIATAGLWAFTALLWNTTRRAVADGEKSIKAATDAAKAAADHVGETAKLADAMNRAASAMRDMAEASRDQFNATHRPRLKIRLFYRIRFEDGTPILVSFQLVNRGETDAILLFVTAQVTVATCAGAYVDLGLAVCEYNANTTIPPGGRVIIPLNSGAHNFDAAWLAGPLPECSINIFGHASYRDSRDIVRRTGFDRKFNAKDTTVQSLYGVIDPASEFEYDD